MDMGTEVSSVFAVSMMCGVPEAEASGKVWMGPASHEGRRCVGRSTNGLVCAEWTFLVMVLPSLSTRDTVKMASRCMSRTVYT